MPARRSDVLYSNCIYIHTHHQGVYEHIMQGVKWSEGIKSYKFDAFDNSDQLSVLSYIGQGKKRMDEISTMLSGVARALITIDNFPKALGKKQEPTTAVYQHKCPTCQFVEHYRGYDIYTHKELSGIPNDVTYVGRYSDYEGQYVSERFGVNSVADFKVKVIDKLCMLNRGN